MTKKTDTDKEYRQTKKRVAVVSAQWQITAAIESLKEAGGFGECENDLKEVLKKIKATRKALNDVFA